MLSLTNIQQEIFNNKQRFLDELFELLRIPSVSADPKHQGDLLKAAELIALKLKESGAENICLYPTAGNPIVYGDKITDPSKPTVLVYGHYDVQPADPLDLWHSPPFEPVIKDEKIYARGSCDDKGQMFMHIKAFELMNRLGELPCNIKFMIEGEEEIGSSNLETFVKSNTALLAADVVLISDTSMIANDIPSINTGLRGLSYMEVEVTGPNRDLHSGVYGGAVTNPINTLCTMIASLTDHDGRITIPGFYDHVQEVSLAERAEMAKAPFNLKKYEADLDIADVSGEKGFSVNERTSIRPTLDVNGIWGGYTGEGAKTVLPSKAFAKISMRLVPGQVSAAISSLFKKHFKHIAPAGVTVRVKEHHGGEACVTPTNSKAYLAAAKAMAETFGKPALPQRSGGSIPVVALFQRELNINSILLGFGLDSDAIHSPNEHYGLFNFYKGIETIPLFYKYYAETPN